VVEAEVRPAAQPAGQWAPIWRRWLAALYDSLLLAGVALGIGFLVVIPASALGMPDADLSVLLRVLLLVLIALYFGTFWRHAQRTPGMRAWHLVLMAENGRPGWARSLSRTAWMLALLLLALMLYGLLGGITGTVVAMPGARQQPRQRHGPAAAQPGRRAGRHAHAGTQRARRSTHNASAASSRVGAIADSAAFQS
jgi:RDD family.